MTKAVQDGTFRDFEVVLECALGRLGAGDGEEEDDPII